MQRSRRQIFKMIGMAPFLAAPFRKVLAADAAPLKRMVIMMRYNGAPTESWYPKSATDFSGSCLASLGAAPLRDKLVVMKGLSNPFVVDTSGDHHRAGAYGSWAAQTGPTGGVSLDQYIADRANFGTPRKSIMLGAVSKIETLTSTFYKASGSAADINDSPYDAIDSIFKDFTKPNTGAPATVDLAKGKSAILDAIRDDLGRLSRNLVGEEKQKLEEHLSFVRAAEVGLAKGLTNMSGSNGAACSRLTGPATKVNVADVRLLPEIARLQIGLITMALACDISRIFVLQLLSSYTNTIGADGKVAWCDADINRDANIVSSESENPRTLHQYHHSSTDHPQLRKVFANINTAYAELFTDLLTRLNSVDDGGGKSLLDNSVAILGSEYGGNALNGNAHDGRDLPMLLAGSGGGFFKTGQILNNAGRSHTQLLGTLLEYFGLDDGTGNPSGAFGNRTLKYSFARLPGLKA